MMYLHYHYQLIYLFIIIKLKLYCRLCYYWLKNAIKAQCQILVHFHCSLIVFQLHLDYIMILHFNCIFIALYYDCIIITLRLHFYYITFGLHFDYTTIAMMQAKWNLNYCFGIIVIQLHFDCINLLHFDYIFITLL